MILYLFYNSLLLIHFKGDEYPSRKCPPFIYSIAILFLVVLHAHDVSWSLRLSDLG